MIRILLINLILICGVGTFVGNQVRSEARLSELIKPFEDIEGFTTTYHVSRARIEALPGSLNELDVSAHTRDRTLLIEIREHSSEAVATRFLTKAAYPPSGRLPTGDFDGKSIGDQSYHTSFLPGRTQQNSLLIKKGVRTYVIELGVRNAGQNSGVFLHKRELDDLTIRVKLMLKLADSIPVGALKK